MQPDDENTVEMTPAAQAVQNALAGNATDFQKDIESMLYSKVSDAIAVKKLEVASAMFGPETEVDDEEEIEDETDEVEVESEEEDETETEEEQEDSDEEV